MKMPATKTTNMKLTINLTIFGELIEMPSTKLSSSEIFIEAAMTIKANTMLDFAIIV